MFGKALDVGAKRDVMGAVTFYAAHVVVLAGISTVLVHVLGMLGVVEGGKIPYLPEAIAQRDANFANRLTADPVGKCYLGGVPRSTYIPYPFQIFQD